MVTHGAIPQITKIVYIDFNRYYAQRDFYGTARLEDISIPTKINTMAVKYFNVSTLLKSGTRADQEKFPR